MDFQKLMKRPTKPTKPTKPDISRCKKHPKHQQSPGVCSLCLKEKLEKVSHNKFSSSTYSRPAVWISPSTTSSISSYYSSSSASSSSSPVSGYNKHFVSGWENNVLSKSRSMVNYFPRRMRRKEGGEEKKKRRFWEKLLRPRSKRKEEGLVHSRTVRETRAPTAVF